MNNKLQEMIKQYLAQYEDMDMNDVNWPSKWIDKKSRLLSKTNIFDKLARIAGYSKKKCL